MAVTDETLRLTARLRRQLEGITNRQTRDIVAAYARGWDDVAGELDDALQDLLAAAKNGRVSRAQAARSARLTRALATLGETLTALSAEAGILVVGDLDQVVRQAGEAQARILSSQLPPRTSGVVVGWDRVSQDEIDAIVVRSTQQVTALTRPLGREATAAMRRELVRGVAVGANPRETAARMLRRTQGVFEGGSTRALVIARTETLDAHRAAAALSQQANADVLRGWAWQAELDSRTCPACFGMHGTEHPLADPGPLGHQQCRCSRLPLTKTWADLGFDIDEAPSLLPNAQAVFDQLDPAEQLAVLGRRRYDAWADGRLPMDQWPARRTTAGWRDSYVPVKAAA